MPAYRAPLRDMRFVLDELIPALVPIRLPADEEHPADEIGQVLAAAGHFCETELAPLNRVGDEEGCIFENGTVRTPSGFAEAYRRFREAGWTAMGCDPEHGGTPLPATVTTLVQEMISSANLSFGIYPGLSQGAYRSLNGHASAALKQQILPRLVDGTWTGTMCLTEPHCGTDLGLLRTRAVPHDDGSFRLTGTKIFISAGEHDLADNIVHLVLARIAGAPNGVKGISLFVVPKLLPAADGTLGDDGAPGRRNGVRCGGIEHKMGINGSSTCTIHFDDATGWLVGAPHTGLRAMFTMMNAARLAVGVQGLGLAEASYQGAVAYARERLQGRAPSGAKHPERPADPIVVHPDVRRMLLTQRAIVEGCRALAVWTARHLDLETQPPDPAVRREAADFVALMTPIVKALLTDLGFAATNLGVQVLGGHGYIRDNGMEQHVRDGRIAMIYEGTNGVQALDLVGRKLGLAAGRPLRRFFHPVAAWLEAHRDDAALAEFVRPLDKAFVRLQQATAKIARAGLADPDEAGAAASDYLRLFGLVALAYLWARMAALALARTDAHERGTGEAGAGEVSAGESGAGDAGRDPDRFYAAKLATARFFFDHMLPETGALFAVIMAGGRSVTTFEEAAF
ncbi:acyl-CoA dehydrogenase C-terminal domain-containing protein [Rhodoplanes sp. SY1]|uniref:acyl-CoA dehydrogenase C-terminal domain-containing protein n=1 Tax=Rhodoplanes sp. SY1 TaxID=3166646 RepID=UPI0038B460A6